MNQLDIKKVANAVTEEPIEIIIWREPENWIDELLVKLKIRSLKRSFIVKPPSVRMCYQVTALFADIEIHKREGDNYIDWGNKMITSNTHKLAEIVALYLHNSKEPMPDELVDFVLDNVKPTELEYITSLIKSQVEVVPFINSISSMRNLDLISPSLMEESLQNTGEIIAPGDLSEAQQSTSGSV